MLTLAYTQLSEQGDFLAGVFPFSINTPAFSINAPAAAFLGTTCLTGQQEGPGLQKGGIAWQLAK